MSVPFIVQPRMNCSVYTIFNFFRKIYKGGLTDVNWEFPSLKPVKNESKTSDFVPTGRGIACWCILAFTASGLCPPTTRSCPAPPWCPSTRVSWPLWMFNRELPRRSGDWCMWLRLRCLRETGRWVYRWLMRPLRCRWVKPATRALK
jgi:hypothetical protein